MSWFDDLLAAAPQGHGGPGAMLPQDNASNLLTQGDAALSLGTGVAAQAAGLLGYAGQRSGGASSDMAQRYEQGIENARTYQPRTQAGKDTVAALTAGQQAIANTAPVQAVLGGASNLLQRTGMDSTDAGATLAAAGLLAAPESDWAKVKASAALKGLPTEAAAGDLLLPVEPNQSARRVAATYNQQAGITTPAQTSFAPVNKDLGAAAARAYGDMEHNPGDPKVARAYAALRDETLAQYDMMRKAGVKVYGYSAEDNPYSASPRLALQDINQNNTLRYFRSDDGSTSLPADHPMAAMTDQVDDSGNPMSLNDVFRVTHDYFGHAKEGVGFGPRGEYNAFLQHGTMYSPEAQQALATETHGQNSYVNFGPDAEHNAAANEADTKYAPQKAGILPPGAIRQAPFPQYAENYPPIPEPVLKTDPKSGKSYLGKGESPENADFMQKRAQIQSDIKAGNYEPFYDVNQRFDADPSNYPTDSNTLLDTGPAKQATADKHNAAIQTPEALARLNAAFDTGAAAGGHDRWYQMGQLEKSFTDELGPVEGRQQFQRRFANAMSATTGGADPTSNLLMAHYGNYLHAAGQAIPDAAYKMPSPIGGRYATGNMAQYGALLDNGGIPVANPKRFNFSRNFLGDTGPSTIDEQMTSLIAPGQEAPKTGQYPSFQGLLNQAAAGRGVAPRDFQDVAWGGAKAQSTGGAYQGKPMIQHVNEAIERTSRLTGLPPAEVVRRGLVRAEIPLYGLSGAALGAGMLFDNQDGGT